MVSSWIKARRWCLSIWPKLTTPVYSSLFFFMISKQTTLMERIAQQKFQNMFMVIGMTNYGNNTNEYSVFIDYGMVLYQAIQRPSFHALNWWNYIKFQTCICLFGRASKEYIKPVAGGGYSRITVADGLERSGHTLTWEMISSTCTISISMNNMNTCTSLEA